MTNESIDKAIDVLTHNYNLCPEDCGQMCTDCVIKAYEVAISALEKAEKYRWHDLRTNPNDLPFDGDYNLLVSVSFRGAEMWTVCSFEEGVFRDGINPPKLFNKDIKAWRYIEPFEEVNE